MLSVNYMCNIVHYRNRLWVVIHYAVLWVLWEVMVGHMTCGRLHMTEYVFPDALILWKMEEQKWLMLCWRSFWTWGREHVTVCFSYNGGQYLIYDWLEPITSQNTTDARPKIIHAPLMLIVKMGQGACSYEFCVWRWLIVWLCITMTESILNCLEYKTWHCSCSIDPHFAMAISAICNHVI